jgi:predicted NAD/FAD-dependent oxidoreductase
MTVVVVGAGIAGLSAAAELTRRGHAVVVLEQGPTAGGRVATRRVLDDEADRPELATLQFDHGAQYFTARTAAFIQEVDRWQAARVVQVWHGRLATFDSEGREAVEDEVTRWVGVPSMSAVPDHLARGLDVRYGARVTALTRATAGPAATAPGRSRPAWRALLPDRSHVGPFDGVVLAVPAPQIPALLAEAPRLLSEVSEVRMHPCWAVLVAFDARVPTPFDAAFVSSSPLGWIARDRSKPQRGLAETWVLHASGPWSEAHVDDRPDAVGPFLLNAFADLVRGALPRPVHVGTHRWRYAAADPPLAREAFIDAASRVALCGDWCAGNRMEGAYLSGRAAAAALAESID